MARGKFITIEGIEGVGKSTNLEFVAQYLREVGHTVVTTREPGGTRVAEQIRDILLGSAPGEISDDCELMLLFAARASHVDALIEPALARGDWVVCDRFLDATYAYQGGGRGLPVAVIDRLAQSVLGGLLPDLTLLLDAPLEVADQRRDGRGAQDRFEREDRAFFQRVQACYRDIARSAPERVKLIDASGNRSNVTARIDKILTEFIENNS